MPNKFIPPQTTTTTRTAATPLDGEILYDTDEKKLYYGDGTTVGGKAIGSPTVTDNVFRIQDNSDATKQLAFETSGITTGTTRTLTVPDSNGTVLSTDTLTDKALYYYDASSKLFKPIGIGTLGQTLIAQPSSNPPYQWATPTGGGREVLTANRTYYVRTDGSDSNDGLSNTAGGAFLTWNKALAVVSEIDLGNFNIEITDGIGATYTENIVLPYYRANNGRVTLSAHASGTTLACSSGNTVTCDKSGTPSYTLENFTITAHEICIFLDGKTELFFAGINFGACGLKHIAAFRGALVKATGNYTISGDPGVISAISGDHAFVVWGAMFICNVTVTLSGSRNFGGKFVQALRMGACDFEYLIIVGSATGQRYTAVQMGFIKAPASGSNLPGSIAGTTGTGGIYA